jgi:hypothetical protein
VAGSSGGEATALAARCGLVLDPWQAWVLEHALGERPGDGRWAAFEVGLIIPRQNGKNAILEARELAGLFLFGEQLIIHTAHQFKTARRAFMRIRNLIESVPEFDRRVAKVSASHGEEGITLLGGQELLFLARSGSSGRGFTADLVVYDEAMILDSAPVQASLPSLSAMRNPQVWYTGSAGLGKVSTQLARVRRAGIAGTSRHMFFAEWSIDWHTDRCEPSCTRHDDPLKPAAVARSNPSLGAVRANGTGLTLEACERELDAMGEEPYAVERLGVGDYPSAADDWAVIPRRLWEAAMVADMPARAGRPVFAIDTRPDMGATAIGECGPVPGRPGVYALELADHAAGMRWAVGRAAELDRRHGPTTWVVDKRAAAGDLIDDLTAAGLTVVVPTAAEVAHACVGFYDAVTAGDAADGGGPRIIHNGERAVARALAGADKRKLGESWAWDRTAGTVDLCPLVAFTLAHWGAVRHAAETDYDLKKSVGFGLGTIRRMFAGGMYSEHDLGRLVAMGALDLDGAATLAAEGLIRASAVAELAAADH